MIFLSAAAAFAQDAAILGSVRDSLTHAPVAGVAIEANGPVSSHSILSDTKGEFRFEHLPRGAYRLKYTLRGYLGSEGRGASLVTLERAGASERIALEVIPVARLEGLVLNEEGRPLQGVKLYTGPDYQATTAADGRYTIERLQSGYRLTARVPDDIRRATLKRDTETGEVFGYAAAEPYPGEIAVTGGLELRGFDLRLHRVRLVEFSGRVVERAGGEPLAGSRLELLTAGQANAGAGGAFHFDLLQPGNYTLLVYRSTGPKALPYAAPIEIGKAGIADMRVAVPPFPSLQGTVLPPPDTEWSGQLIFRIRSVTISGANTRDFTVNTPKFTIDDIPPGKWSMTIESTKLFIQSAAFGEQNALAEPLAVTESSNPPLEIRLTTESGSLAGTALDENGLPLKGSVILISRSGAGTRPAFQTFAWTKEDGSFLAEGLVPGTYRVIITERGRSPAPNFVTVEIKSGETTPVRLTAPRP